MKYLFLIFFMTGLNLCSKLSKMINFKCRNNTYPFSKISRLTVPDQKVSWDVPWEDYNPPIYNSDVLQNKPWADPDISDSNVRPLWNELDGKINRKSYLGEYKIINNYPLNPEGRTGLRGRGVLGKWGPNHAADPIVSRWKRINGTVQTHKETKLPILQICVIQRHDNHEWALPGGMVDPGEQVSITLRREFMEEAMNSLQSDEDTKSKNEQLVEEFFASGNEIYKGYIDDPRNTDNAWMETVAVNFHDEDGTSVGKFNLQAGDDARNVKWLDINKDISLYASHSKIIEKVIQLHNAYW